jgi:phosphohistidine phosphatase SixA
MERSLAVLLRVGFAMCFIGHGAFGLLQKRDWLPFFERFGIGDQLALFLMPLIGSVDIAVGLAGLLVPCRFVFFYGAAWCVFTAALRPLTGLSAAELLERAGNYGVPIAILAFSAGQQWFRRIAPVIPAARRQQVFVVCAWTTATLLVGHGWLALQGKAVLVQHASMIGLGRALPIAGVFELALAFACIMRPSAPIFAAAALWKVGTESLFVGAGSPIWEFIERGGSYVAPFTAAMLVTTHRVPAAFSLARLRTVTTFVAIVLLQFSAQAQAPSTTLTPALLGQLREGGLVVACRHAITSHDREDRMPVNFEDPSTQRILSPEGEAQARTLGKALAALNIPFGQVLASPFQRTRLTAELLTGRAEIDEALSSMSRGNDSKLRALMSGPVAAGGNRLLVTHQGLIYRSFTTLKQGSVAEGDCLIVRPKEPIGEVLAQLKPGDWKTQ